MEIVRKPLALQRVWKRLVSFFDGGPLWPRRLARFGFAKAWQNRAVCLWLRRIEETVRRLLMLEAISLDPPPVQLRRRAKQTARRPAPACCCEHLLAPPEWRVRFRVRPHSGKSGSRKPARRRKPPALYPTMPLARRAEAVWRVLRDRRAYALRLARRINSRSPRHVLLAARVDYPARPDLARGGARKAGVLLGVVHGRFVAALDRALRGHALSDWDSS